MKEVSSELGLNARRSRLTLEVDVVLPREWSWKRQKRPHHDLDFLVPSLLQISNVGVIETA